MNTISIALPPIEAEKAVEVAVTVNGHQKMFRYRVEVFPWSDWWFPPEPRADSLRRIIASYDKDWQLMQIGTPDDRGIPLMFKRIH